MPNNQPTCCSPYHAISLIKFNLLIAGSSIHQHVIPAHPYPCGCATHQSFAVINDLFSYSSALLSQTKDILNSEIKGKQEAAFSHTLAAFTHLGSASSLLKHHLNDHRPDGWHEECIDLAESSKFMFNSCTVSLRAVDGVMRWCCFQELKLGQSFNISKAPVMSERPACHSNELLLWSVLGIWTAASKLPALMPADKNEVYLKAEQCLKEMRTIKPTLMVGMLTEGGAMEPEFVEQTSNILASAVLEMDYILGSGQVSEAFWDYLSWVRDGCEAWITEAAVYQQTC